MVFREANVGLGTMLMRFAVARGYEIADAAGCRLLTLDAYPDAIAFYKRLGFQRNRAKPYREREHPSMRLDLFAPGLPSWL
jgi:ribosomal protein S18 acetylase RimI-like enzyme